MRNEYFVVCLKSHLFASIVTRSDYTILWYQVSTDS